MKIGLVCPYNMFQYAGGVQEIVVNLHEYLKKRGHSVKIITSRPRNYTNDAPDDYILLGRSTKVNTFSTMVDIGFEADGDEIEKILKEENFDLLHFHEPWVPLLSRQILSRSQSVNVATFHAKSPETIISKSIISSVGPYTKSILNYLDALTAVSPAASDYVSSMTNRIINIVPNGIELHKYMNKKNVSRPKNAKKILFLGRLEKRKGIEFLIDAYSVLKKHYPHVRLDIAGSGAKRKYLEKYVKQNNIEGISFLGYVSESKKIELMNNADVYCSPAPYGESFGMVLLESMAVGVPIVAGNNVGYSGVLSGKGRLSLVNPRSTNDFYQRLEIMLFDDDIRKLWKSWASKEILKYDFDKITDQYEKVYIDAINNNGKNS